MSKVRVYANDTYFEDDPTYWEHSCVKHLGEGCVCWMCEAEHQDTQQGEDDWESREYFDKEYKND